MSKQYYPSDSSDGDYFISEHCSHCVNHDPDDERHSKDCPILVRSFFDSVIEWAYGIDNKPTCTNYKFHDWANGEPDAVDPNQLELFKNNEL